ncbi:hypothetical protein Dsin_022899 [Dipteronia sinensis]|uniref:Uncharacterized protein n=1 Tax=Dipteronia sinensis TaxID=43782 RepID=A0AAE0A3D1_9ROSI|nr:hypothetical protein Dsin_022899 [Dipteronia sinensis]
MVMELYPGFALYRELYEFGHAICHQLTKASLLGVEGMSWADLSESSNGMLEVLIIMFFDWWVLLIVAYYIDQILSSGGAKEISQNTRRATERLVTWSLYYILLEKKSVVRLMILTSLLVKVIYPARDGNPDKLAMKGFNLALSPNPGECFGMLGPNGAIKTTFKSMMIGAVNSCSGAGYGN